ncbi:hypothetical protein OAR33_00140 [bacterium]|nr:hypothetical protein [bacterium]
MKIDSKQQIFEPRRDLTQASDSMQKRSMRRFILRIARLDAAPTEIRKARQAPWESDAADSNPLGTSAIAPACVAVVSSEREEPRGADRDQKSQAGPLGV